jgi:hypothetical protein
MTRAQIEHALDITGNSFDQWISLEYDFKYIIMKSDKNSFIFPESVQFYFSGDNDYFLTRHLIGKPTLTTQAAEIPDGYGKVFHEENYYLIRIEAGGVVDSEAGIYHTLTAYNSVTGMFNK